MPWLFWLGTSKRHGGTPALSPLCCGCGRDFGDTLRPDSPFPLLHTLLRPWFRQGPSPGTKPCPGPAPTQSRSFSVPSWCSQNMAPAAGTEVVAHGPVWPHWWGTLRPGHPGQVWLMPFGDPAAHVGISASPSLLAPAARAWLWMEPEPSRARSSEGSRPKKPRSLTTTDHSHSSPSWRQQPTMFGSPGSHIPELGLNFGDQAELFCPFALVFFKLRHSKYKLKPP